MREAFLLSMGRLVCTVPWFVICCVPLYPYRRVKQSILAAIITAASLIFFGCNYFLRLWDVAYASHSSLVFCLLYLVMGIFLIRCFRVPFVIKLYIFLLVQAVSTTINYTAALLLKPFFPGERISLETSPPYILAIFLLTLVVGPAIWYFFTHQLQKALQELQNKDFRMLCVSPVLFFVITVVFSDIGNNTAIPQEQAIAIFLLIAASGLITYFIHVNLALSIARHTRTVANLASMERQISVQVQSYAQLTRSIEAAQMARHDLRHHLGTMTALAAQNNIAGLSAYLAEYRQGLPEENSLPICGNYTVDIIARHCLQQAQESGAKLDIRLNLPAETGILNTDLTVVFGNLLENAANSVSRQKSGKKYVSARCGIERGRLLLTVDNSVDEAEAPSKEGIGQSSVKAVVEKYHGTVRFRQQNGVYEASVLLVLPS